MGASSVGWGYYYSSVVSIMLKMNVTLVVLVDSLLLMTGSFNLKATF